ncbi:MAG: Hint domain-containing protein, partial [Paracoccaceae bacterium]
GGSENDSLTGGAGNDQLSGDDGDDWISGGDGANQLFGGMGADTLVGGADGETLSGGAGNDNIAAGNGANYVDGNDGSDSITAGSANDTIYGGSDDDKISAGAGADLVEGDAGNDWINGGDGDDSIAAGEGANYIDGNEGADSITSGAGNDTVYAGIGDDSVTTGAGSDEIYGDDGNDNLTGEAGADALYGGADQDRLSGGDDADQLSGGKGNDSLFGDAGQDKLAGDDGNDQVFGGDGSDTLSGGTGSDTLEGGEDSDSLIGGGGEDVFVFVRAGGADRISDFNLTRVNGRTIDQLDVSDLRDAKGGMIEWSDVIVTDTKGDGTGDAVLTFPQGEQIILEGVSPKDASGKGNMAAMGMPCFAKGTLLQTERGWQPVETITQGTMLMTLRGEAVPALWSGGRAIGQLELAHRPSAMPVRIAAGALGNTAPLTLSQQHAVLMQCAGRGEVLVQASHLIAAGLAGIHLAKGMRRVAYHHVLLPRHDILIAQGAAVESLYPGRQALLALSMPAQIAVAQAIHLQTGTRFSLPLQLDLCTAAYGPRCRPLLRRSETLALAAKGALTAVWVPNARPVIAA